MQVAGVERSNLEAINGTLGYPGWKWYAGRLWIRGKAIDEELEVNPAGQLI